MTTALKKIINLPSKTIASAAFLVGLGGLISRLLGLLRTRLLAGQFGAGDITDAYYAAFRIPDFVYAILIMGAISSAFIPVFTQYLVRDKKEAWQLANGVLNLVILGLAGIGFLGFLLAPRVIPLIAPGFAGEKLKLTISLARIMFLSPLLLGISSIFSGMIQSFNRFFVYSLAPAFYNLGIIFGIIFLVPVIGPLGLAWGVVLGAAMHWFIQVPTALMNGWRWQGILGFRHLGVKKIGRLMVPRTIGQAATQINLLVITVIASFLTSGSLTIFTWANDLQCLPIGIFGVAFATAAFPRLARDFAKSRHYKFFHRLEEVMGQVFFFVLPASVILIIERAQIVRLVLGTGEFDWTATRLTAACLALFALSIFAQSLSLIFNKAFYARHNTKTPVALSVVSICFNIFASLFFVYGLRHWSGLNYWLSRLLSLEGLESIEVIGLALAFSLANLLNLLLLLLFFIRLDGQEFFESLAKTSFKIIFSSTLMAGAIYFLLHLVAPLVNMRTGPGLLIQASAATFGGLIIYLLTSWLIKVEPMRFLCLSIKQIKHN